MLERKVCSIRTRKSTVVGGSSTNLSREATNATTTQRVGVMCAIT